MAIVTKEELMNQLHEKFGESKDDSTLKFLEDITDTLNDYESKTSDSTDWKTKYEKNDEMWRTKYQERFFKGGTPDEEDDEPDNEPQNPPTTFDSLFK